MKNFKEELEDNGFVKQQGDPMFLYRKELVDQEQIFENNLIDDEVPCLLYGRSINNRGFCIYTGEHFIWLNVSSPEEASEYANKIVAFEPI